MLTGIWTSEPPSSYPRREICTKLVGDEMASSRHSGPELQAFASLHPLLQFELCPTKNVLTPIPVNMTLFRKRLCANIIQLR